MVPEPDQQVTAQADQFPAHEQQQQVVRHHHPEHRRREQRQETEKPREILVVGHVTGGVDKDHQPDKCHHRRHARRERVEDQAEPQFRVAEGEPGEVRHRAHGLDRALSTGLVMPAAGGREKRAQGQHAGKSHRADRQRR